MSSSVSNSRYKAAAIFGAILALALVLGLLTTWQYVLARGIDYLEHGHQIRRHSDVIQGNAGAPWQYRVLAPFMIEYVIEFFRGLNVPYHLATSFILFRVFQDTTILLLSYVYYRKLGASRWMTVLGMLLLAFGMGTSHFDSDFQFNTFFDVIFYLLAGICILYRWFWMVVPITILAAFNRETSGLIPFMLLVAVVWNRGSVSWLKGLALFIASLGSYGLVYQWLRAVYPEQVLITAYNHQPGLELLSYNLWREGTWVNLAYTLNLTPLIAIAGYSRWPAALKVFFWTVVPIWFLVHALGAVMAETRLFLVPLALVFVPGTLTALSYRPSYQSMTGPPEANY
jgi:hypothetical protein